MNEKEESLEKMLSMVKDERRRAELVFKYAANYDRKCDNIPPETARSAYETAVQTGIDCGQETLARLAKRAGLNEEAKKHCATLVQKISEVQDSYYFPRITSLAADFGLEKECLIAVCKNRQDENIGDRVLRAGYLLNMRISQIMDTLTEAGLPNIALSVGYRHLSGNFMQPNISPTQENNERDERMLKLYLEKSDFDSAWITASRLGRKEEAEQYFEKMVDLALQRKHHSPKLVAHWLQKEHPERAMVVLEQNGFFGDAGRIAENLGMPEKALDFYMKTYADSTAYWKGAFEIAKKLGREDTARKCFEAMRKHYESKRITCGLVDMACMTDSEDEKRELYRTAIKQEVEANLKEKGRYNVRGTAIQTGMLEYLVELYEAKGLLESAYYTAQEGKLTEKAAELAPKLSDQYKRNGELVKAARLAKRAGMSGEAEELYTKAVDALVADFKLREAQEIADEGNLKEIAGTLKKVTA